MNTRVLESVLSRVKTEHLITKFRPVWPRWTRTLNWQKCTLWSVWVTLFIQTAPEHTITSAAGKCDLSHLCVTFHLQGALDEAIETYKRLHMWDDAIALAEAKVDVNVLQQTGFTQNITSGSFYSLWDTNWCLGFESQTSLSGL